MAQVFGHGLILALKTGGVIAVVLAATLIFAWRWRSDYPHAEASPPQQPLPFSHQHHVRDDGIDCRYCHTAVEESASAGMPGSDVCMTCHSQLYRDAPLFSVLHESVRNGQRLRWTRVHDLPDFVFFDHSAHVTHGVACRECHGRVDQMPAMMRTQSLDMQWCLACHHDPAPHLTDRDRIFSMTAPTPSPAHQRALLAGYGVLSRQWLTDCSTCHR